MGRYDRISVMTSNGFVQPQQIYIKKPDGDWADLGTNNSEVQDTLDVYKTTTYHIPATLKLRRRTIEVPTGDPYTIGRFQLLPTDAYCFNSSKGTQDKPTKPHCDCWIRTTMQKTADVDQIIYHDYNKDTPTINFLKITWKANGTIEVSSGYKGTVRTFSTSNAVMKDQWVYFEFYSPVRYSAERIIKINFNGTITTSTKVRNAMGVKYNNYIGDTYLQFKDSISVQMVNYPKNSVRQVNFNINNNNLDMHTALNIGNLPETQTIEEWV